MNRARLAPYVVSVAVLVVGALASPAAAQKTTLAPGVARVSNEPRIIVNQIEMALVEEKKALATYEVASPTDDLDEAHQAATNAYVLIRSAKDGMYQIKARKKFADPVIDLAFSKLDTAWNRSRGPVDHMQPPGPARVRYLQDSVRQMSEAISLMEQVLLMWP